MDSSKPGASPGAAEAKAGAGERVYFPHLDGLRFWAFFAVFVSHSPNTTNAAITATPVFQALLPWFKSGTLGVSFFFVLSGFLITYLLLAEYEKEGRIDVKAFYIRRALRIWPLYFAVVAVTYALRPGFPPGAKLPHLGYYLSFTPNFAVLRSALLPPAQQPYSGQMTVLWSVGVEEQFYVLWPLLMVAALALAARLRFHKAAGSWHAGSPWAGPPLVFALVCALSLGFRVVWRDSPGDLYWHTLAVVGDMALGGWAAWKCFVGDRWAERLASLSRLTIVAAYAALCLAIFVFEAAPDRSWERVLGRPILAAGFAFVIMEQCYAQNSFYKCGRSRWLSKLGTYTYGLYCLHEFAITIVQKVMLRAGADKYLWQLLGVQFPLALALSIVLATLSYRFYEAPFLRLKRRFAHVQTT